MQNEQIKAFNFNKKRKRVAPVACFHNEICVFSQKDRLEKEAPSHLQANPSFYLLLQAEVFMSFLLKG